MEARLSDEIFEKGVDLADGWYLLPQEWGMDICAPEPIGTFTLSELSDDERFIVNSALAAQLVRQVDALPYDGEWEDFICCQGQSGFFIWDYQGPEARKWPPVDGDNRSENTITAITESGVLEFERVR